MLFLTYEKSAYQFLREYFASNALLPADFSIHAYNRALVDRAQEFGFQQLDEYCRYVLYLPYREFLAEVRVLALGCQPAYFYRDRDVLDSFTAPMLEKITSGGEQKDEKPESSYSILKRVLTKEIKLKAAPEAKELLVMGVEAGAGEDVFSAVMRLHSLLQDGVKIDCTMFESNSAFVDEGRNATFHQGKISRLSDNFRSLYFEKTPEDWYKLSKDITHLAKFINFDFLNCDGRPADEHGRYHIILAGTLHTYYPKHIADRIVERIIPCIAQDGLLVTSIPAVLQKSPYAGLEIATLGKTRVYRRTGEECRKSGFCEISPNEETLDNRLFFCKFIMYENRLDEAQKEIDSILETSIENLHANYFRGDLYVIRREFGKAINQYNRALIINPLFLPARFNLAALHLLNGDKKQALEEIDKVISQTTTVALSNFKEYFNVEFEVFRCMCTDLKNCIQSDTPPSLEELLARVDADRAEVIEIPEIEIPDLFEQRLKLQEIQPAPEPEEPKERVVVNISELPSTRDYGEHDPWKKKLEQEEEERRKQEEKETEKLRQEEELRLNEEEERKKWEAEKIARKRKEAEEELRLKKEKEKEAEEAYRRRREEEELARRQREEATRRLSRETPAESPCPPPTEQLGGAGRTAQRSHLDQAPGDEVSRGWPASPGTEDKTIVVQRSESNTEYAEKLDRVNPEPAEPNETGWKSTPAHALFLDSFDFNNLKLPEAVKARFMKMKEEELAHRDAEVAENEQAEATRRANSQKLGLSEILPTSLLNAIKFNLEEQDFESILDAIGNHIEESSGMEREILEIFKMLCEASLAERIAKKQKQQGNIINIDTVLKNLKLVDNTPKIPKRRPKRDRTQQLPPPPGEKE